MTNIQKKDVPNFEGIYYAKTDGYIYPYYSNKEFNEGLSGIEFPLKPAFNKGYFSVRLCKNGRVYQRLIHRLIAQIFIPNPQDKPEINHKNGVKSDNRLENLEWCTPSENVNHAFKNGLIKVRSGEDHVNAKFNKEQIEEIRNSTDGLSVIAKKYRVSRQNIYAIRKRLTYK